MSYTAEIEFHLSLTAGILCSLFTIQLVWHGRVKTDDKIMNVVLYSGDETSAKLTRSEIKKPPPSQFRQRKCYSDTKGVVCDLT